LLEAGADPNYATAPWQNTPLMAAARMGDEEAVRLLLAAGANPNARSADGRSVLDFALLSRKPKVRAMLEQAGASLSPPVEEPATLPWLVAEAEGGEPSTPEATLYGFIVAMNRWEGEAARLSKSRSQKASEQLLDTMQAVFDAYCTPRPRPFGRNGSFNVPPEYNPQEEALLERVLERSNRAILITRNKRLLRENRYVALKRGGKWLLDNKKIRALGGDWIDWSL
jgi:hypothetical protein